MKSWNCRRGLSACAAVLLTALTGTAGSASGTSGSSKNIALPLLLPTAVYYGGVLARNQNISGAEALELKVPATGQNAWDEAVQEKLPNTIPQGDVLLATFKIRVTQTTPNASVVFNAEAGAPSYSKAVSQVIKLTPQWKKVSVPFKTALQLPEGSGDFDFFLDTVPQTVEITNFQVIDYGKTKSLSSLPQSGY